MVVNWLHEARRLGLLRRLLLVLVELALRLALLVGLLAVGLRPQVGQVSVLLLVEQTRLGQPLERQLRLAERELVSLVVVVLLVRRRAGRLA